MGVDIHTKLVKYNSEDNLWHELKLYRVEEGKYKKVYIFDGRNYELFDIMQGKENDDISYFPSADIPLVSLDEELREEIEKDKEYCYHFHEISLADMEFYLYKHPTIPDYDADWGDDWKSGDPKPQKDNPVKWIYDECIAYAEFADNYSFNWTPRSRYKLLYWFDS